MPRGLYPHQRMEEQKQYGSGSPKYEEPTKEQILLELKEAVNDKTGEQGKLGKA